MILNDNQKCIFRYTTKSTLILSDDILIIVGYAINRGLNISFSDNHKYKKDGKIFYVLFCLGTTTIFYLLSIITLILQQKRCVLLIKQ